MPIPEFVTTATLMPHAGMEGVPPVDRVHSVRVAGTAIHSLERIALVGY